MTIPFLDLKAQHAQIMDEIQQAFLEVTRSCAFVLSDYVKKFEGAFAAYLGVPHVVGLNSGTDAIILALKALGIGHGDEVITAANTFYATAEGIIHTGAMPVFVDAEEETALIDVTKLERAITKKTKAIIPVHLYGQPADMDTILEIARKHKLYVVEDACQAAGSNYQGKKAGTMGDIGCFSFYPCKNLGALGDGGAIATNNPELEKKVRMLGNHGGIAKYQHEMVGYNSRLDALQAVALTIKLGHLDKWNAARNRVAERYRERLSEMDRIKPFSICEGRYSNHHLFVVRTPEGTRARLMEALSKAGVQTGIHYPEPLHKVLSKQGLYPKEASYPVAEKLCSTIISLPMYAELSMEGVDQVVEALKRPAYALDVTNVE